MPNRKHPQTNSSPETERPNSNPNPKVSLTNQQVLNAYYALTEIAKLHIPLDGAMNVADTANVVEPRFKTIVAEHNKLLDQYTLKDGEGKPLKGEDGQPTIAPRSEFDAEDAHLMELIWETDKVIRVSDLRHPNPEKMIDISPAALISLGPLLIRD